MNIKELIERLRLETTPSETTLDFAAEALLAQQVVIEKMREVLARIAACPGDNKLLTAMKWAEETIAIQPDLSALREHDAEVCEQCYHATRGASLVLEGVALTATQVLSIYQQLTWPIREYAERIRKGEA